MSDDLDEGEAIRRILEVVQRMSKELVELRATVAKLARKLEALPDGGDFTDQPPAPPKRRWDEVSKTWLQWSGGGTGWVTIHPQPPRPGRTG